jgi:hypothetical protein
MTSWLPHFDRHLGTDVMVSRCGAGARRFGYTPTGSTVLATAADADAHLTGARVPAGAPVQPLIQPVAGDR